MGVLTRTVLSSTFQAADQKPPVHKGASVKVVVCFQLRPNGNHLDSSLRRLMGYQLNLALYFQTSGTLLTQTKLTPNQTPYDFESNGPRWETVFKLAL